MPNLSRYHPDAGEAFVNQSQYVSCGPWTRSESPSAVCAAIWSRLNPSACKAFAVGESGVTTYGHVYGITNFPSRWAEPYNSRYPVCPPCSSLGGHQSGVWDHVTPSWKPNGWRITGESISSKSRIGYQLWNAGSVGDLRVTSYRSPSLARSEGYLSTALSLRHAERTEIGDSPKRMRIVGKSATSPSSRAIANACRQYVRSPPVYCR